MVTSNVVVDVVWEFMCFSFAACRNKNKRLTRSRTICDTYAIHSLNHFVIFITVWPPNNKNKISSNDQMHIGFRQLRTATKYFLYLISFMCIFSSEWKRRYQITMDLNTPLNIYNPCSILKLAIHALQLTLSMTIRTCMAFNIFQIK